MILASVSCSQEGQDNAYGTSKQLYANDNASLTSTGCLLDRGHHRSLRETLISTGWVFDSDDAPLKVAIHLQPLEHIQFQVIFCHSPRWWHFRKNVNYIRLENRTDKLQGDSSLLIHFSSKVKWTMGASDIQVQFHALLSTVTPGLLWPYLYLHSLSVCSTLYLTAFNPPHSHRPWNPAGSFASNTFISFGSFYMFSLLKEPL